MQIIGQTVKIVRLSVLLTARNLSGDTGSLTGRPIPALASDLSYQLNRRFYARSSAGTAVRRSTEDPG
jgi:hypothetical protein